jgi:hypothetical protein
LATLAWRWRGAYAALLIGGGGVALANIPSLGLLDVDARPVQAAPDAVPLPPADHVGSPERSPPVRRGAPAPSPAAWSVSASPLKLLAADLALDWAPEPATVAGDTTTDDQPDIAEFVSVSSPVGALEELSSGRSFDDANSLASLVGGSGSGAGGGVGGQKQQTSAAPDPTDPTAGSAPSKDPVQPVLDTAPATGPVPEPATWMTMILGLGLTGAMLRSRRRIA